VGNYRADRGNRSSKSSILHDDSKDKREWMNIVIGIIYISTIIISVCTGMRIGYEDGIKHESDVIMKHIHDSLDAPCFDKLVKSF